MGREKIRFFPIFSIFLLVEQPFFRRSGPKERSAMEVCRILEGGFRRILQTVDLPAGFDAGLRLRKG